VIYFIAFSFTVSKIITTHIPLGDLGATYSSLDRILPLLALRRGDPISANDALELSGAV